MFNVHNACNERVHGFIKGTRPLHVDEVFAWFWLEFRNTKSLYQLHILGGLNYALNERFSLMYYGSEVMTFKSWYDDTNSDQCHIRLRLIDISDYHDFRHLECHMFRKG